MKYKREKTGECFLGDTSVENVFIREYMVTAPENYTKAYLFGLMASGLSEEMSDEKIESELGLSPGTAARAWNYWAKKGLVAIEDGAPVFLSVRESLYGSGQRRKPKEAEPAKAHVASETEHIKPQSAVDTNSGHGTWERGSGDGASGELRKMWERIEGMLDRRSVSGTEISDINRMMEEYNLEPGMVTAAYEEGSAAGNTGPQYIKGIIRNWAHKDIRTEEQAKEYRENNSRRQRDYKEISNTMGFFRGLTEAERKVIDSWFDDLGCTMDDVKKACGKTTGINNPNIKYIDKIIRGDREKTEVISPNRMKEYYRELREKAEGDAAQRKEQVHGRIPETARIDRELVDLNTKLVMAAIDGGATEVIRDRALELQRRRKKLLTEAGIPVDYENPKYRCGICKDRGVTEEGTKCRCYVDRENELRAQLKTGRR